jgi:hypothetical protein
LRLTLALARGGQPPDEPVTVTVTGPRSRSVLCTCRLELATTPAVTGV